MEASALMAIARYRSIPFGEVVMAGDSLAGGEWQHRGWMTAKSARRQLFASATDAAVALTRVTGFLMRRCRPGRSSKRLADDRNGRFFARALARGQNRFV